MNVGATGRDDRQRAVLMRKKVTVPYTGCSPWRRGYPHFLQGKS